MAQSLSEDLIESVYQAAVEPQAWNDVMVLLRRQFPSAAQTFYLLRRDSHQIEPISLAGIDAPWLASFNALYFAPDNPWMQLTQRLHRPGIVRTNERLDTILQQHGVLYRSSYYNEWMRPQGFKYTIGNTLLDDAGLIANITLMRQPDMPSFSEPEVRAFERLSRHMTRALQLAVRIDQPQSSPLLMAALDRLPECIAVTDANLRVRHANGAMESLLRRRQGLCLRHGLLATTDPSRQAELAAYLVGTDDTRNCQIRLDLPCQPGGHLTLRAVPLARRSFFAAPSILLMASEHAGARDISPDAIRQQYGLTRAETRLALSLAEGNSVRQAAQSMGIGYGTARVYLKSVFGKTDAHTQAQLVARILVDAHTRDIRHDAGQNAPSIPSPLSARAPTTGIPPNRPSPASR